MSAILAFLPNIGPMEMLILGFIALLLFGKRLPEVMRNMGKGITEFKKGMSGMEEEMHRSSYSPPYTEPSRPMPIEDRQEVTAPKFQPPVSAPTELPAN